MRCAIGLFTLVTVAAACGDGGSEGPLFPTPEPCAGQAVETLAGQNPMVISSLKIADRDEGFDLDRDGEPDNQLAGLGSLSDAAFADAFATFSIVLPIEFFDFAEPGPDECVKFAVYFGNFKQDGDDDGSTTAAENGDCNDHSADQGRGKPEIDGNRIDDDCDGLADEIDNQPNPDTTDQDGDTVSLADGDCDDTRAEVAAGKVEVCGDGLDNDCDGRADWSGTADDPRACNPFDADTPDAVSLDARSFESDGSAKVAFEAATVEQVDGALRLRAGPDVFRVEVPLSDSLRLDLTITGATIEGDLVEGPSGWGLTNARLGGVLDAISADTVRGLEVPEIQLVPESSLLDAVFANVLSVILGLKKTGGEGEFADCYQPDIDVDRDGLEIFCDSNPLDETKPVDVCVDGDGTVVRDGEAGTTHCTEAVDADGVARFQDGISIALVFEAVPATLSGVDAE